MPQLRDPNFERAVMLLLHHDDQGTFGLVLNRPGDLLADQLCRGLDVRWRGDPRAVAHWGGPVQPNTGWVLVSDPSRLGSEAFELTKVIEDVYFAGSLAVLKAVAEHPPADVRLYLGYAGWAPGQLEEEMAAGAWLVAPGSPDFVFGSDHERMWDHVVRSLGIDPASLISTSGVH